MVDKTTKKLDEKAKSVKEDSDAEGDAIVAKLIGEDGKIKVDTGLPKELETEIMASMLLDHIISYRQTKEAWRAARNTSDHQRATQLFQQMQYNQLTSAIIQSEYPKAKPMAENIAKARARTLQQQRKASLAEDEA
mgnify:CR=1 FL=1